MFEFCFEAARGSARQAPIPAEHRTKASPRPRFRLALALAHGSSDHMMRSQGLPSSMERGGRAGEREEYRLIWNIIIYNNMGDGGARLARATLVLQQ